RHTRATRDWSSDVCSSDLLIGILKNSEIFFRFETSGCLSPFSQFETVEVSTPSPLPSSSSKRPLSTRSSFNFVPLNFRLCVFIRSEERRVGKECRSL